MSEYGSNLLIDNYSLRLFKSKNVIKMKLSPKSYKMLLKPLSHTIILYTLNTLSVKLYDDLNEIGL